MSTSKITAVITIAAFSYAAAASAKETCYVDELKYTNKTSNYLAIFTMRWSHDGKNYRGFPENNSAKAGGAWRTKSQSEVIYLDSIKNNSEVSGHISDQRVQEGDEVWGVVQIEGGENKNCRKDNHKLVYMPGIDHRMGFKTSGTTLQNNRCKFDGNMDKSCKASQEKYAALISGN